MQYDVKTATEYLKALDHDWRRADTRAVASVDPGTGTRAPGGHHVQDAELQ